MALVKQVGHLMTIIVTTGRGRPTRSLLRGKVACVSSCCCRSSNFVVVFILLHFFFMHLVVHDGQDKKAKQKGDNNSYKQRKIYYSNYKKN